MTAGLVASMHDIHIAYLPGCRGQSHFEDTTYRFGRLAGDTDSIEKREFGSVSLSNADIGNGYWKWYSRLSIITHEVRSRDYGLFVDVFMMEVAQGVKAVANPGIN